MTFKELNLINPILKAITDEGYEQPSPIQAEAIPLLLEGRDMLGCAQTGTGKTAAFAIPIIQRLKSGGERQARGRLPRALILTPTRELAAQVAQSFDTYGRYCSLKTAVVFGGVSQVPQLEQLKTGVDILVATPGRLCDLINQKLCELSAVSFFVLDEADRMLDMGFINDVRKVIALLPKERQTLLFSATMPNEIASLARSILKNPATVTVTPVASVAEIIDQYIYYVDRTSKSGLLIHLIKEKAIFNALVFSRTKHRADQICRTLNKAGIKAGVIHGDKSQGARQRALSEFTEGKTQVLVATDIAARGIDIDQLSHVFNYDLPEEAEAYVHRIGRTGRAGHGGTAISFCDFNEISNLSAIEKLMGRRILVEHDNPYPMKNMDPEPTPQKRPRTPSHRRGSGSSHKHGGGRAASTPNTKTETDSGTPRPSGLPKQSGRSSGMRRRRGK